MGQGACTPAPAASMARRRFLTAVMFAVERHGPDPETPHPAATEMCSRCGVRDECLAYAMRHHIKDGTWGGYTAAQRDRIRRGRPPVRTTPVRVKAAGRPPAPRYVSCKGCGNLKRSDVPCGCGEGS